MGNVDKIADLPQERRNLILRELRSQGKLVAAELSERYGVSEDTIRRDLRELAQAGLLKRVHGGALPVAASKAPYYERDKHNNPAKLALARAAGELVRDGQLIILGSGTTNAEIARNLPIDLRATVVTPSPLASLYLAEYPHVETILIGGRLNRRELVTMSAETLIQIKQFQADVYFLGVCSLHPEAGITINSYGEMEIIRTIINQSGEVVTAVTADKLGTVAPFVVAPIEHLTHLITEGQVADEMLAPYRSLGIQVSKVK
jgi:DeoR/GlpR family transcriptional regulator of sugar metabolism